MKKCEKKGEKGFGYIIAITHLYRIPLWIFDCVLAVSHNATKKKPGKCEIS